MCEPKDEKITSKIRMQKVKILYLGLILLLGFSEVDAAIITSINYLFEGFSPYAVIRFFEFSDKGWNISENCLKDMYSYMEGLRHSTLWAVKLYDASSYYSGGVFGSSKLRMHNKKLCHDLRQQYERQNSYEEDWPTDLIEDVVRDERVIPFAVNVIAARYMLEIEDGELHKLVNIQQQICFPQSCTSEDLVEVLQVHLFQSNEIARNNTYISHRILDNEYSVFEDEDFYILLTFFCSAFFVYAFVEFLKNCLATKRFTLPSIIPPGEDFNQQLKCPLGINLNNLLMKTPNANKLKTVNFIIGPEFMEPAIKPKIVSSSRCHRFEDFLHSISLHSVLYNLFETTSSPQQGIFVIFTTLLIYAHLATEVSFMANNLDYADQQQSNFVLQHLSFIFDVYFFVSGAKLAVQFLETIPQKKLNAGKQLSHIMKLILQKIFCLTPSYTFSLFFNRLLAKHFLHNIALEFPSYDYYNCKDFMLTNTLYLDTFYPIIERCMPWTWFMSLEVQFFIIACLVLLMAEIHTRYAAIIGVTIFLFTTLAATFCELNPGQVSVKELELSQFNLIYNNVCLRIGPYLHGICLGYMLHKSNFNIQMNVFVLISGWFACILILIFFFFGYQSIAVRVDPLVRAFLNTLTHTMWSMILLWTMLTAKTQYGAALNNILCVKWLQWLHALSPICLLISPIVIRLFVFTADAAIYTSAAQIFVMFIGCLAVAYGCALVLHILLDGPICAALEASVLGKWS